MDQDLLNRIRQCEGLPTLPTIAVQVLEVVRNPRSEIPHLARLVSKDPALATKILRTVNSSIYSRPKKVSKLTQALTLLGLQTVRVLVLGFTLVRNLRTYKNQGFRPMEYWRRAIYSASAALTLAQRIHFDLQEEAFIAALLMDVGMLVLDDVMGEQYGRINEKARNHSELVKLEEATLGTNHAEVSGLIADWWGIPQVLAVPMGAHHKPQSVTDPKMRALADICFVAGRCADVFVEESSATAINELREVCLTHYHMTDSDCDALLTQISRRTAEIAPLFDLNVNVSVSYETVLKKANDSVIQLTLASQQQAQQEKNRIQEQSWLDPQTKLANRARFDAMLAEEFAAADPASNPLSLVMFEAHTAALPLDETGVRAAEAILAKLAETIQAFARPGDLVARLDERIITLLASGATRSEALSLAEGIRRQIIEEPIDVGRMTIPITISAGVAAIESDTRFKEPAHLLRAASLTLDAAKAAGRNSIRAFSRAKQCIASAKC